VNGNLDELLWPAAGLAALLLCLPMIVGMLGGTILRVRTLASPADCEPSGDEEYAFSYHQLRGLGFEPLGVKEESAWFFAHHYVKRFRSRVFFHAGHGVYAAVYELVSGDGFRVLLSTLLADGRLLQTGSCLESLVISREKYYRWGVTTRLVGEQLRAHLDLLRDRWQGGVIAPVDLEALAARSVEESRRSRWGLFAPVSAMLLGMAVALVGTLAIVAGVVCGWHGALPAVAVLTGCLLFHPLLRGLRLREGRKSRQEDLEKRARQTSSQVIAGGNSTPAAEPPGGAVRHKDAVRAASEDGIR